VEPTDLAWLCQEHRRLARRYFLQLGAAGAVALQTLPLLSDERDTLSDTVNKLETWLTAQDDFRDVSRGKPKPHSLPEAKKKEVGLTRETWRLEVVSDEQNPASLKSPLTRANNTALDFDTLVELGKTHAVRFAKVMTCLNIGCPLGTGIWEGVPLRTVLWLTQPQENLRRVFYYGYHNDDDKQMFRSSLPVGRVLEDPFNLPPVILCYKLNGQWLTPERGAPVRMIVPEAYGFKSIKWLSHVVLSNLAHANDTYGEKNNDVDSPLKTFCALFPTERNVESGVPLPLTGWAQVGMSGLGKVQVWVHDTSKTLPGDDPYFTRAPWRDAQILGPPKQWGGGLPSGRIPRPTMGFEDETGEPKQWPLSMTKVHWALLHPALPPGKYLIRCRTIDENGVPQPMPRPFRKSGHAAIQQTGLVVE